MKHATPRRAAFVLSSLRFGGGERVALNLAHALKAQGCEIDLLLMRREGEFLEEAARAFNVVDLDCSRTWRLPGRLAMHLLRHRPDALISSFWKLNLCACLARLAYPRCKLLLWEHSPPSRSRNSPAWLYAVTATILYQLATRVVAVSTGVFRDVLRITIGLHRKTIVIFNPVAPPVAGPAARQAHPAGKALIWVGRLDHPKNPCLAVEAFALLPRHLGCTLQVVGDGSLRAELESLCDRLGVQDRVRFLGYRHDAYALIAASDLLILSSDREGLPTVLVEAMYCGLPVVSTDCGEGIHDILLGGRYGSIVPPGDKRRLAEAIQRELALRRDMEQQRQGASRFRPEVVVRRFLAALGTEAAP